MGLDQSKLLIGDREGLGQFNFDAKIGIFFIHSWGTAFLASIAPARAIPLRAALATLLQKLSQILLKPLVTKLVEYERPEALELVIGDRQFRQIEQPLHSGVHEIVDFPRINHGHRSS